MKILFAAILLSITVLAQTSTKDKSHPYSGTVVLSALSGVTLGNTDVEDGKIGFSGSAMLEYFVPTFSLSTFGIRVQLSANNIKGKQTTYYTGYSTDIYTIGTGVSYMYSIEDQVFPYVFGGFAFLNFFPNTAVGQPPPNRANNVYRTSTFGYNFEFGARILTSANLSVNVFMNFSFPQTDWLDDTQYLDNNDKFTTIGAGISFALTGEGDDDEDGITDKKDNCPNEKEDFDGFEDEDGCPELDNDKDGILDVQDKCPTFAEDQDNFEDYDGCPDLDNDSDGITDNIDKCPSRAEDFDGIEDYDGCPDIDNDRDGILDAADACPNNPEDPDGFQDTDGCPDIDNDNDGILDHMDKCPNNPETLNNYQDQDGCPDEDPSRLRGELTPQTQKPKRTSSKNTQKTSQQSSTSTTPKNVILEGFLTFEDYEDNIKPQAYKELDKVAEMIKKNPSKKFRIEGFVDKDDNNTANLGGKRANEVMLYLIKKGVPVHQVETADLGSKYPRSNNDRPSGKALNRRVEIKPVK